MVQRVLTFITDSCSDYMCIFYQLHMNIMINLLWCSIISEILQLISNYIYSSWPILSISFLPSVSFFLQTRNFEINNSKFTNMSSSVQSSKKDLKDYSYYKTILSNVLTLQVSIYCTMIVFLLLLITHMKLSHTSLVALKRLECSISMT